MNPSRREFMIGTAAAGAAWLFGGGEARAAAQAPAQMTQVASVYRHKVGDMTVTTFMDGYLIRPLAVLPDGNTDEGKKLLAVHYMDTTRFVFPVNCHAISAGGRLLAVDTGGRNVLGPTAGRFHSLLRAAGLDPAQVSAVLMTHMHPDHVSGAASPEGQALFPNAEMVVHENEWKHWHSDALMNKAPEAARGAFKLARAGGSPYKGRLRLISKDGEVAPGITAIACPGHTAGHTAYLLSSGRERLLIWGDIVNIQPLQFLRPDWAATFDLDKPLSVQSRKRILDMASQERLTIAGTHLGFPGIGNVSRRGSEYDFIPARWQDL
ncbi:MAG: MBL fold metallo-hydrolase [Candidatus Tectomicrobia bacterium]|uniref:MBL fold metallo-hydrolase n=1 Tax=Tectimicrobiota bacterium TaxID=2528274 RepID=A0A932HY35_UNCTE|nr:MBL fold metallo-hydrolase [Candidatus Tectomicrobia bacterium]